MKKKEKERIEKMKIDRYKRCWDELELLQYNSAKWQAYFTGVLSIYESMSHESMSQGVSAVTQTHKMKAKISEC